MKKITLCFALIVLYSCLLFSQTFGQGTLCTDAIPAVEGVNIAPVKQPNTWYTFASPAEDGLKIVITTVQPVYFEVVYNDCNSAQFAGGSTSTGAFASIPQNVAVHVHFITNSVPDFSWNLSFAPVESGETCALAETAVVGQNTTPDSPVSEYWFKIASPNDGKKISINSPGGNISVFAGDNCDDLYSVATAYQEATVTIPQFTDIYIQLKTNGVHGFDWDLAFVDPGPGDNCAQAVSIEEGKLLTPHDLDPEYWFRFTVPDDADNTKLAISSDVNENFYVYRNTCDDLYFVAFGTTSGTIIDIEPGEDLYIVWSNFYPSGQGFQWTLELLPVETGDVCSMPFLANEGINVAPIVNPNEVWFAFTMPDDAIDKTLVLTTDQFASVTVYKNSCDDLEFVASAFQDISANYIEAGEQVYIVWTFYDAPGDLKFNLSLEDFLGNSCDEAVEARPGPNQTPAAPYWFWYTKQTNGSLTISSLGLTDVDTYLRIYNNCNGNQIANVDDSDGTLQSFLTLNDIAAGTQLLILWDNVYSDAGFEWTLKEGQTITMDELPDKTYGDDPIPLYATASSGYQVSFSVQSGPGSISEGTLTITGAGEITVTVSQAGNDEYTAAPTIERSFSVAQALLQVTADDKSISFNQAIPTLTMTYDGFVNGDDEDDIDTPPNVETAAVKGSDVGIYDISLSGGSDDNYTFNFTNGHLEILKSDQQISVTPPGDKNIDDDSFTLDATADSGLPVSISILEGPGTWNGQKISLTGDNGLLVVRLSQDGNGNYNAAPIVDLTIVVNDPNKDVQEIDNFPVIPTQTYGGVLNLQASASSDLAVTFNLISGPAQLSGNSLHFTGVGDVTVQARQQGNDAYNAAIPVEQTFPVVKAMLTVTANNLSIAYGTVANFTIDYSGFRNGDDASDLDELPEVTHSSTEILAPGAHIIFPSGGSDNHYDFTHLAGTLSVNKATQTILFDPLPDRSLQQEAFHLSARSTSGLPISYTSSDPSVATLLGDRVIVHSPGATTILAIQTGNSNYLAATPVEQVLVVKNDQSLTFESIPSKSFGNAPFALSATASSGLDVTFLSSNENVATIVGNMITIVGTGNTTITALQNGNQDFIPAVPVAQLFIVDQGTQSIDFQPIPSVVVGDDPFMLTASSSSGLPVSFYESSGNISLTGNVVHFSQVGIATITAVQDGNANYRPAQNVLQTFCVNPEKPVISLVDFETDKPKLVSNAPFGNQWYRDGEIIPGETSSSLELTSEGIYTVAVSVSGCSSEPSDIETIIVTRAESIEGGINIYPNPTRDQLTIDGEMLGAGKHSEVVLHNAFGVAVKEASGTGSIVINLKDLPSGVYYAKIKSGRRQITRRVVKK